MHMTKRKPPPTGGILFQTHPVTPPLCDIAKGMHLEGPVGTLTKSPVPGEFWRHFKGGVYRIVAIAMAEATQSPTVVYTGDSGTWTRPMSEFMGWVSRDGYEGPRFVPAEMALSQELVALRRVVRAMVRGTIGKSADPTSASGYRWWGACGYIHGATLPEVLKNLAGDSGDDADRAEYLEEMAAVESALKVTPDGK